EDGSRLPGIGRDGTDRDLEEASAPLLHRARDQRGQPSAQPASLRHHSPPLRNRPRRFFVRLLPTTSGTGRSTSTPASDPPSSSWMRTTGAGSVGGVSALSSGSEVSTASVLVARRSRRASASALASASNAATHSSAS